MLSLREFEGLPPETLAHFSLAKGRVPRVSEAHAPQLSRPVLLVNAVKYRNAPSTRSNFGSVGTSFTSANGTGYVPSLVPSLRHSRTGESVRVVACCRFEWAMATKSAQGDGSGGRSGGSEDLFENAVESIENGIEDFSTGLPKRITSALRNLYAGVLLLLKEKLRILSPPGSNEMLLYKKHKLTKDLDGNIVLVPIGPHTVDFAEIEQRLTDLGVPVNWKRLKALQDIRNNVEHHKPKHSREVMREAIANAFVVIADFVEKQLGVMPATVFEKATWETMLSEATTFKAIEQSCRGSREQLQGVPAVATTLVLDSLRCTECSSTLVRAGVGEFPDCEFTCQSCAAEMSAAEIVEDALEHREGGKFHRLAKEGEPLPVGECPSCNASAFVLSEDCCFFCGEGRPYDRCLRCEAHLSLEEQELEGMCSYCDHMWHRAMEDD